MSKIINVILSGGVGSRLWPLSRKNKPKQYLDLFNNKSLFQLTALRNKSLCDKAFVLGNIENYKLSDEALSKISYDQYTQIIESTPRNTAAAIAFAAFAARENDILLVTPSDHLIEGRSEYEKSVLEAVELAKENYIVTFGLIPTRPETGFGYIQIKNGEVLSFREKPNLETAQEFMKSGDFYWNSGMFCFKAGIFLQELKKYAPFVYEEACKAFNVQDKNLIPLEDSLKIPSISVDYAVLEKTKLIKAVKARFQWSDMGSFESLYNYFINNGYPVDKYGNMVIGTDVHTEFLGLKKVIFINTDNAILILKKDKSQEVKKVYEKLEQKNSNLIK
ncbi:mannose-1-phosphate guanylyltransferase [Elizabethkingia bruuniana]|uniref:Mannose-1-phosphate guanylyltransferase n=1 Tax=Elizabethkingia bruuniana TaxID=1756149 RepID=A0A7T7UVL7_9FLAO|nr:sugar phosphate nucleotidyltransferase [Elizabethkingia bruuniana]AQX83645.1 mannose-1-phosphate guanylyltransferase [Elizabethkingia bruuniana]KUY22240.1 mannose-1-phosphate guanylyltransferase [Elizabethkingia bruuniana]OPB62451.1 mannose-1-phosphate guanylyltransferase [Elizabethkingia bruuniana]QDZ63590.1 mannose-1-phosphate guanylyltransferase [Elizabethkingia bruuniana]QQN57046.1 mannose-1-phosphate guanylyltransferase [Elizabethkingia bruuniana]